MTEKKTKSPAKKGDTKFKPGQSGNPNGRPPGSRNKSTMVREAVEQALLLELEQDAVDILKKGVKMAKEGNEQMIALFINKFLPNARADGDNDNKGGFKGINIVIGRMGDEKPAIDITPTQEPDDE